MADKMEIGSNSIFYKVYNQINVEYLENKKAWNMNAMHFHNSYEFMYFLDGERELHIGNQTYILKPGQLLMITPGEIHMSHKTAGEQYMTRYLINFSEEHIKGVLNEKEENDLLGRIKSKVVTLDEGQKKRIEHFFGDILNYMTYGSIFEEKLGKFSLIQLIDFCNHIPEEQCYLFDSAQNAFRKDILVALDYISLNRSNPDVTLKDVADYIHMSQSRFCSLFKETTGLSFLNYLNSMRVMYVEHDLINSNAPLKQIAMENGFTSVAHMSRNFCAKHCCNPTEYRMKKKKEKENYKAVSNNVY